MTRAITPLAMPDIVPGLPATAPPAFRLVNPGNLVVDDIYQRNLSERSLRLIRRIVAGWDWRRFKPPIVVETQDGLEVIDGQHTAIAAISHGALGDIPVMVVQAEAVADRASAFIGHNRDRLQITATQMHHAAVAAGDDEAVTIEQVCQRAGVRILKLPPSQGVFRPRETMAVSAIGALVRSFGALRARQILDVLAAAECAPIRADAIKAAAFLMSEAEYRNAFHPTDLSIRIREMGEQAYRDGKVFGIAHKLPAWRGLAITWFKGVKRVRRAA